MHGDHRLWENEISFWRDDLRVWQRDAAHALGQLDTLKNALEEHVLGLRRHASSLRLEEEDFGGHEHAIVQHEQRGEGDELFGMAARHTVQGMHHIDHQNAHEVMKLRHRSVMARWNALLRAIQLAADHVHQIAAAQCSRSEQRPRSIF